MNKSIILVFIATIIGSVKNAFFKKYVYDKYSTLKFQVMNSVFRLIINIIIFVSVLFINNIFNYNLFDVQSNNKLEFKYILLTFGSLVINSVSSLILREEYKKSNNFMFITTLIGICWSIFDYLCNLYFFDTKFKYIHLLGLFFIISGTAIFKYN